MEPDQIDMMNEKELKIELRETVRKLTSYTVCLETLAAQDSGIIGSTRKSDCMASLASACLRSGL